MPRKFNLLKILIEEIKKENAGYTIRELPLRSSREQAR